MEVEKVIDLTSGRDNHTFYYVLLPVLGVFFYHITFQIINKLNKINAKLDDIKATLRNWKK